MYKVQDIRSQFPILERQVNGRSMVYLDNAATTQAPKVVVEAINTAYALRRANVHRGVHTLSQEATAAMEATRSHIAQFIGAGSPEEIIFTRGTTEAINLVAASYGSLLSEGDEIIVSAMEHHSNIVPWQMLCSRRGTVLKVIPLRADGSLDMDAYRSLFSSRTRLVAVAHVSNVLGTVNPIAEMVKVAHENGALILVDGAQAVAHLRVDVSTIDADFYAFSAHKMYGPSGVGVLYGKRCHLEAMPPYQGGGEMIGHVSFSGTTWADLPYKFEAGTPDYIGVAAFNTAITWLEDIGIENVAEHEHKLLQYATEQMQSIEGMRIFGTTPDKAAVISFLIGNAHHYDTGVLLDRLGLEVRTGHHCAQPLMEVLKVEGTVRASFAAYNTYADVDAFIAALRRIAPMLL